MKNHLIFAVCLLVLSACGGGEMRQTLGLNRAAPDEFKVVSRPPLSVPPEFFLRPPAPGEPPRVGPSTEDEAAALILKRDGSDVDLDATLPADTDKVPSAIDPVVSGSIQSSGESVLLENAGAAQADEAIRTQIHQDQVSAPVESEGEYPLQRWLGIGGSNASVVDAEAESARIRKNRDKGKPVNEGEVKTMKDKPSSVIDQLF